MFWSVGGSVTGRVGCVTGLVSVLGLGSVAALAQTPTMVADLVTVPPFPGPSSSPRFPVILPSGDVLFILGEFEGRQGVLFRSDGTLGGTRLVDTSRQVRAVPPMNSQDPWSAGAGPLCFFNDLNEVWKTDGTSRGTLRLATPPQNLGPLLVAPRGYPSIVTVPSGRVFWLSLNGQRLVTSDGTTQDDAREAFSSSGQYNLGLTGWNMAPLGNRVVFAGQASQASGVEPLISDGTPSGTIALGDLAPGGVSSNPRWFVSFDDRVFFVASSGANPSDTELWVTDGTPAGTRRFADLAPGAASSNPEFLTVSDRRLWFTASPPEQRRAMWHTDGVSPPVAIAGFIASFYVDGLHRPVPFAGGVTHVLNNASGGPLHLVRTTGVTSLTPANNSLRHINSQTGPIVVPAGASVPERLYFTGERTSSPPTGQELFAATALAESATLIADVQPGSGSSLARPLAPVGNGRLLVSAMINGDRELYISDGTSAGTTLLSNLAITHINANPSVVVEGDFPEQAAFTADSTEWGSELFATDGTSAGTQPIVEFTPGAAGKRRIVFKTDNGWLSLYDGANTTIKEVWFHPFLNELGAQLGSVSNYLTSHQAVVGDNLIFTATNPGLSFPNTATAWSAGNGFGPAPLRLVEDGGPTGMSRYVTFGGAVYFGGDADPGLDVWRRLYRTDGTGTGTVVVWDDGAGNLNAPVPQIVGTTSDAIVLSFSTAFGSGIYVHAPASATTTQLLPAMWSETATFAPGGSALADGVLYFGSAYAAASDYELWRTDATAQGTYRVRDISPGVAGSRPRNFCTLETPSGPRIFFTAETPAHGRELWTSDGTQGGTRLVIDLFPGPRGSSPTLTFASGTSKVFFCADDGLTGVELWETDGTVAGTRQVADLNPGPESSFPQNLSIVDGRLWFSATTRATGRELYSMVITPPSQACEYDFNQDELVNLTDAQLMAQVAAGVITADPSWLSGDLNGDENADLTDAQILAAFVASGVCPI
jgi:ELWxxDGT repeat protein